MGFYYHSSDISSHTPKMSLQSTCTPNHKILQNFLVTSPCRNSNNSISSPKCERQLTVQSSPCWDSDKAPGSSSISSPPSNDTSSSSTKSCAELVEEIFGLEDEIAQLERHLLSLYRTALIKHLPTDSSKSLQCNSELLAHYKECETLSLVGGHVQRTNRVFDHRVFHSLSWASNNSLSSASTPKRAPGKKSIDSGHRSLANHLGTSCTSDIVTTPDKISENIARCMSAIYCKISDPSLTKVVEKHTRSYETMREVLKVHLNDDNLKYASNLLQRVRSMIHSLEKIDPRTMKREGKLAFWINIHNALMMHAYLAYGTRDRVKDESLFKAAYNIGGHFINPYTIQTSILGIRPHYSAPWLQLVLSSKKFDRGSSKHIYAIEYPEPLVHFSLSSGAHSDPAIRAYSASDIFQSLKLAKDEFLRANVFIDKESKVFLPKILYYFAKDMSLDVPGILKVVDESVSRDQQKAIKRCIEGRKPGKFLHWLSQSSSFRYLIHEEDSSPEINKS